MVSNAFVVLMGIGTVFVGLVCLVIFCELMSFFIQRIEKQGEPTVKTVQPSNEDKEEKEKITLLLTAVMAEELGVALTEIKVTF